MYNFPASHAYGGIKLDSHVYLLCKLFTHFRHLEVGSSTYMWSSYVLDYKTITSRKI